MAEKSANTTPEHRKIAKDCPSSAKARVDKETAVAPLAGGRSVVTLTEQVIEYSHILPRETKPETVGGWLSELD
jgi:hypothetical protein